MAKIKNKCTSKKEELRSTKDNNEQNKQNTETGKQVCGIENVHVQGWEKHLLT